MRLLVCLLATGLAAALVAPATDAATIYDAFSPSCPDCISGGAFGATGPRPGPPNVGPYEWAASFVPAESGRITELVMGLRPNASNVPTATNVIIYSDAAALPGDVLETIGVSGITEAQRGIPLSILAAGTTLVEAGQRYWISVAPLPGNSIAWSLVGYSDSSFPSFIGPTAYRGGGLFEPPPGEWQQYGGRADFTLRVNATVVPLPAASTLFLVAVGCLVPLTRDARRNTS